MCQHLRLSMNWMMKVPEIRLCKMKNHATPLYIIRMKAPEILAAMERLISIPIHSEATQINHHQASILTTNHTSKHLKMIDQLKGCEANDDLHRRQHALAA